MPISNLILLLFAIGHFLHVILLVNVSHGLGVNAKWMDRAVMSFLGSVGLLAVAVAWALWGRPWIEWPLLARMYSGVCLATLFVGVPAVTLARAARRMPHGIELLQSAMVDLAERCGIDALAGSSGRSFLLRMPCNEAFRLDIAEWGLTLDGLHEALDGLTILHLTDLHFAPAYQRRFFEEVLDEAIAIGPAPDLVLITGDFLDDDDANAWVAPLLSRLSARLGKFAILGNHDYRQDFRTLRRELRRAGFTTLEGRWAVLDVNGVRLAIGGTSHPWGKDITKRPVPEADARILLSHAPDEVYKADRANVDLMLSGHNHGGQIRLPVIGPVLTPSRYSRRFDRGFFRIGRTLMFAGQGIGAMDPIRIGCRPEVSRFLLRSRGLAGRPVFEGRDEGIAEAVEAS